MPSRLTTSCVATQTHSCTNEYLTWRDSGAPAQFMVIAILAALLLWAWISARRCEETA